MTENEQDSRNMIFSWIEKWMDGPTLMFIAAYQATEQDLVNHFGLSTQDAKKYIDEFVLTTHEICEELKSESNSSEQEKK